MGSVEITDSTGPAEHAILAGIWRRAVQSTHLFLTSADIDFYASRMQQAYLPAVDLRVARMDGSVIGFAGTAESTLEMLFVDDTFRGRGVGHALLRDALNRITPLQLDVNEQNPDAVEFYLRQGFLVTGRSEVDADGRPFPLLHMKSGPPSF